MTTSIYHYVYRITNTKLNKHYYGVRSCNCHPSKDIGHKYFSSSLDKDFKEDQRNNPQDYRYKVVSIKEIRKQASKLEIHLHERYDVKINKNFYNKANATNTGFTTYGTNLPCTDEHKRNLSKCRIGKDNYLFTGYFRYMDYIFPTSIELGDVLGLSQCIILRYCKTRNSLPVTRHSYVQSLFLQSLGSRNEIVGKTFRELGFGFEQI